ncbi:MAG TPA: FecR domain-containing protein [Candidatus Limnocylindria bacterium]|nr:FecR domain-containing protein [Candidatus Limnocylindria bacterium]
MNRIVLALVVVVTALGVAPAGAQEAGNIKVAKGAVQVERAGQQVPATVGAVVQAGDVVVTGPDGSVGITFLDNSLLSAGPNSVLAIDRFTFDSTTHQGSFESSLRKGTLAVVSGKLAKQSPDAMKVKTPAAVLGVRGTEFLVRTGDPKN